MRIALRLGRLQQMGVPFHAGGKVGWDDVLDSNSSCLISYDNLNTEHNRQSRETTAAMTEGRYSAEYALYDCPGNLENSMTRQQLSTAIWYFFVPEVRSSVFP